MVASVGKLLNLLRSAEHRPNDRKELAASIAANSSEQRESANQKGGARGEAAS